MRISFPLLFSVALFLVLSITSALVLGDDGTIFDAESNVSSDSYPSRLTSADTNQVAMSYGTTYSVWQGGGDI